MLPKSVLSTTHGFFSSEGEEKIVSAQNCQFSDFF